jgi:hypothetical protein
MEVATFWTDPEKLVAIPQMGGEALPGEEGGGAGGAGGPGSSTSTTPSGAGTKPGGEMGGGMRGR